MKGEPWFYTRQMLLRHLNYIKGLTLDAGAGAQKYRHIISKSCDKYIALDAFTRTDVRGDVMALPFKDDIFDTVICNQVIEHIPRPWQAVREIYRVLRQGGHLLLSAPFLYPYHPEPYDYFRYTREGLRILLEEAGFRILEINPMGGGRIILLDYLQRTAKRPIIRYYIIKVIERLVSRFECENKNNVNTPNHFVVAEKG